MPTPPPQPSSLRRRRERLGLSLRDLEALTGINRGHLSLLERDRYVPTTAELARIEGVLESQRQTLEAQL